jgi:hypothetical protein
MIGTKLCGRIDGGSFSLGSRYNLTTPTTSLSPGKRSLGGHNRSRSIYFPMATKKPAPEKTVEQPVDDAPAPEPVVEAKPATRPLTLDQMQVIAALNAGVES